MSAMVLTRRDRERSLHRYHRLAVQHDLFGAWCVLPEWTGIGRAGRMCSVAAVLDLQRRSKERRGCALPGAGRN